jgi:hypothetical protein
MQAALWRVFHLHLNLSLHIPESLRIKLIGLEDERRHEPSPLRGVRCNPIRYRGTVHKKSHGPTCTEADWSSSGQLGRDSL